jgi:hypothetical protein
MNERERISFIIIQRKSIIQINFKVGNYLMTQNYIHEIGQVEPPTEPSPEDGEVPGTGDHNDDNEDPA